MVVGKTLAILTLLLMLITYSPLPPLNVKLHKSIGINCSHFLPFAGGKTRIVKISIYILKPNLSLDENHI